MVRVEGRVGGVVGNGAVNVEGPQEVLIRVCVCVRHPPVTCCRRSHQSSSVCWTPGRCRYLVDSHNGRSTS